MLQVETKLRTFQIFVECSLCCLEFPRAWSPCWWCSKSLSSRLWQTKWLHWAKKQMCQKNTAKCSFARKNESLFVFYASFVFAPQICPFQHDNRRTSFSEQSKVRPDARQGTARGVESEKRLGRTTCKVCVFKQKALVVIFSLCYRYCDSLLRKGKAKTEAGDLDAKLRSIITIFKYLDEKDVFQKVCFGAVVVLV